MQKIRDNRVFEKAWIKKSAFTLVELIVVITILAILGTIAFISFQWYSASARDSKRIADIQNIKKSLELFSLNTWKYPLADNYFIVSYAWEDVRYQWTVWEQVRTNLSKNLQKVPTDPLTGLEYIYSTTFDQIEFEVLAIYETDILSKIFTQTMAEGLDIPKISWTYNWLFVKTPSYYVPTPSIINSNIWWWISLDLKDNPPVLKSQVVTWWDNIPWVSTWWLDITLKAYTWTITEESTDEEKIELIDTLQTVYSWSQIADISPYDDILDLTDTTAKIDYIDTVVLNTDDYSNTSYSCDNWNWTFYQTECSWGSIIVSDGYSTWTYTSQVRDWGVNMTWDSIDVWVTWNTIYVRSCDDSECSGESWIELWTDSYYDLTIDDNQYFQYKIEVNEWNDVCSIAITSTPNFCWALAWTFNQTECSWGSIVISDWYTSWSYTSEVEGSWDYTVWESIDVWDSWNTTYVRSCDDASCSGEPWVELWTDSSYNLDEYNISNNPYFQYKIDVVEGWEIPNVNIVDNDFCTSLDWTFNQTECSWGSIVVSDWYTSWVYTSDVTGWWDYKVYDSIEVWDSWNTTYVRSCDDASCSGEPWVELWTDSSYNLDEYNILNNPYFQYKIDVPEGSTVPSIEITTSEFCSSLAWTFNQTECSWGSIVISDWYTTWTYTSDIIDSWDVNKVWESIDVWDSWNTVSVRSCDDSLCTGEVWIVLGTDSYYDLNLDSNQYFQYKIDVAEDWEVPNVNVVSNDFCTSLDWTFYQTECSWGSVVISDWYTSWIYISEVINWWSIKIWESIDVWDTWNTTYVHSCNDASCSGEPWVELWTDSSYDLDLDNNQYFQYKIGFVEWWTMPNLDIVSSDFCSVLNWTYYQVECSWGSIRASDWYTSWTYTSEISGGWDYITWDSINVWAAWNTISVRSCDDSECSGEPWIELWTASNYDLLIDDNPYFQYKIDIDEGGWVTNLIIVNNIAWILSSTDCTSAWWIWVDYTDDVFIGTDRWHWFCISPRFWDWNSDSNTWNWWISWNGWWNYSSWIYDWWDANGIDDDTNEYPEYWQTRNLDSQTPYDCLSLWTANDDFITSDTLLWRMEWIATTGDDYTEAQSIAWIVENWTTTPISTVNWHAIPALYIADCIDWVKDLKTTMTYTHNNDSTEEVTYAEYNNNVVLPGDTNSWVLALDNVTYQNRQKYLTAWTQESGSHLPSAFSYIANNTAWWEYNATFWRNVYQNDEAKWEYQVACENWKFWEVIRYADYQEYIWASEYNDDERVWLSGIGLPNGNYWWMSARFTGYYGCGIQDSTPTVNRFGLASARFVVRP